ncbi:MAG: caspase family protein, partial [Eudoraea sp.]|nr:caspase family protein [Eudoraea sp.]
IAYEDGLNTIGDAEDIAAILTDEQLCGYPSENVLLLKGEEADRAGILNAFNRLKEITDENSSVFIFYSGHGGVLGETFHFVPYGMKDGMTEEEYKAAWVTADEIKQNINALSTRRLIFFLDCCHATGIAKSDFSTAQKDTSTARDTDAADMEKFDKAEGLAQKIDNERGISIVASCKEEQQSYQLGDDRNSLFTKHLIQALKGDHQTDFSEPYVRILEVAGYLLRAIPPVIEAAAASSDPPLDIKQEPYVNLEMYDNFILSYVPAALRKKLALKAPDDGVIESAKSHKEVKTIFRESPGANNLLLFIHGFSGEAGNTFGNIPELLMNDSRMDGWDMKPFGYSQYITPEMGKDIWAGIDDIDRISNYLCTSVKYKFDKYDRIAIVAHSLGGLIAQRAILDFKDEYRNKLSHLVLLGTPSNGIAPAKLSKLWNNKYKEMSSEGAFITTLRKDWENQYPDSYPFELKVVASTEDEFVTIDSCYAPFANEHHVTIDGKHLSMVKPKDENDDCYQLILSTLTNSEFHNQYTNSEEINIALGKYDVVVKQLLPRKDELDASGLKRLIFSLEGLDRREEALEILNEHPKAQEDTDLMGIIGGRYKRAYLKFPSESDGDAAFVYYELALEQARAKENYGQIYYHAINLAFLSIVVQNDEEKMRSYAKMALDATDKCKDDPWKIATIAEANLYLQNFDKAREFYMKASESAGIREKISMHLNAYAGYTALMQTSDPEDEFIQFLKEHFLS